MDEKRKKRREGSSERGIVGCRKRRGNEGRKEGGVGFGRRGKEEEGGMNGCREGKGENISGCKEGGGEGWKKRDREIPETS